MSVRSTKNTPGTAGGPGGRDRTLAVKIRKTARKSAFFRKKNKNYLIFFSPKKRGDFQAIFLLFTASVRSRPPGPPEVPGVLLS